MGKSEVEELGLPSGGAAILQQARSLALLGSVVGLLGTLLPWWSLRWTWEGGMFERSTFLYSNTLTGDLSGLGVAGNIGLSIPAYAFANFSLVLVILGFAAGVYGVVGDARRTRAIRALSTLFFLLALVVFVIGLSSVLSDEGYRIFSSRALASSGSHITTGLALGFYFVVAAVLALGFSFLLGRRSVDRRNG